MKIDVYVQKRFIHYHEKLWKMNSGV